MKLAKDSVGFEHPAKGPNHCSQCVHFQGATNTCEIVAGEIKPVDWCKKFRSRMKKRVKSFEVSKMKSGAKGHSYKVTVHHHEQPPKTGRGMRGLMTSGYVPPEEHSHPNRFALNKHINQLTNSMSVSPMGDGDEKHPDGESGASALNE